MTTQTSTNLRWDAFSQHAQHDIVNGYIQFVRKCVQNNLVVQKQFIPITNYVYPQITSASGVVLAIRAGTSSQSIPHNSMATSYTHVEVQPRYVTHEHRIPANWRSFAQAPGMPNTTPYYNVPIDMVNEYLAKQGGLLIM